MVRDANAPSDQSASASALTIYIPRGPIERRVYLYPTGVERKACEKSNRDIKPDLGATLISVCPSDVNIHTPSRTPPSVPMRQLGGGTPSFVHLDAPWAPPAPAPADR